MDTEEKKVKCLNCETEFTGKFCPNCGQKSNTKRLKLREMLADFSNSFWGCDNKFVNTLLNLVRRPGHMVREYLQGKRSRYYNPLRMLIWIISIYAIYSFIIGEDPFIVDKAIDEDVDVKGSLEKYIFLRVAMDFWDFISNNKLYYMIFGAIITVPTYTFAFRKEKIQHSDGAELPLNHAEQFYTLLYQSCIEMIFAILILPFSLIKGSGNIISEINNYADIVFSFILYKQLYNIGWLRCIKRYIIAVLLTLSYLILCIMLISALAILIYVLINGTKDLEI